MLIKKKKNPESNGELEFVYTHWGRAYVTDESLQGFIKANKTYLDKLRTDLEKIYGKK
ncbi:MAG: hypothetical protein RIR51_1540 [Bacteroidota bacterium]|jgi:hypothetical protein